MTKKSPVADGEQAKPTKRKMRPGGGKSKGNGFEGQIAKKLSTALAPLNFMRSPGSGARVGGKNFETFGQMFGDDALAIFVADVVPINEKKVGLKFLHSIECKSYATADNFTAIASGTANVFKWFEESVIDAQKTGKNPLLIFKWNHTPIYVAMRPSIAPISQVAPKFSLKYNPELSEMWHMTKELSIYLLDDLLSDSSFWCESSV